MKSITSWDELKAPMRFDRVGTSASSNTLPWYSCRARRHIRSFAGRLGNPRSSESPDPWTRSLCSPWFPPAQTLSVGPGSSSVPLQQEVRGGGQHESLFFIDYTSARSRGLWAVAFNASVLFLMHRWSQTCYLVTCLWWKTLKKIQCVR